MEPQGRLFARKSSVTPSVERSLPPPRRGFLRRSPDAGDDDDDIVVPPVVVLARQKSFFLRRKTTRRATLDPPPVTTIGLPQDALVASSSRNEVSSFSRDAEFTAPSLLSSSFSNPMTNDDDTPPITARMKRTTPLLSHYQTNTPITKHYDISQQILYAFESYYASAYYMMAYTFGLQYVETVLLEIPKHGYYRAKKHAPQRLQSAVHAAHVGHVLQSLLQDAAAQKKIDDDADVTTTSSSSLPVEDMDHVQSLIALAMEQIDQASLEEQPATTTVCEPLLHLTCCGGGAVSSSPPLLELPLSRTASTSSDKAPRSARSVARTLPAVESYVPPPVRREPSWTLPPATGLVRQNTVSSFASYQSSEEKLQLEKALFLSGLEVAAPRATVAPPQEETTAPVHHTVLQLSILKQLYHEDFDSLQQSGRVRISFIDTYQGRIPASTNGCTVIAPLLCVQHLHTPAHTQHTSPSYVERVSDPGLPDATVRDVLDVAAPVVLTELRAALGVAAQAFLIPADAHDYLLAQGKMAAAQFITLAGGNILHDDHLSAFLTLLESTPEPPERKIAATLFFHEHVVAILQLRRIDPRTGRATASWYDIIDSLPNPETLRRSARESTEELYGRVGGSRTEWRPQTVRFRCLDVDALGAVLKWYACSKFHDENIAYIDQYAWDEAACDFDPRVFQAYIWGSTPSP
jgi:hypothetical protein